MVQDPKRGRGRPRGTGKRDQPTLRQIAELLVQDPSLKPTTAIKRLIGTKDDSDIRRLQVKWKAEGAIFTAQAQERRARQRRSGATSPWHYSLAMQLALGKLGPWATAMDSPSIKAAVEAQARIADLFKTPPEIQALMDAMKPSPAMQTMIDAMRQAPAMQAAMEEATRLTKQLAGSPTLDELRLRKVF
jgi:hypothetical protein